MDKYTLTRKDMVRDRIRELVVEDIRLWPTPYGGHIVDCGVYGSLLTHVDGDSIKAVWHGVRSGDEFVRMAEEAIDNEQEPG